MAFYKILCPLDQFFFEVMKMQSFKLGISDVIPANVKNVVLHIFVNFNKTTFAKFCGAFDNFSRTYEVARLWIINCVLTLVTSFTGLNIYANYGLHVNFWNSWLAPFCFMMEKDHFN